MLTLLLTAQIFWVTNVMTVENCGQWVAIEGNIEGCYVAETNHIYVDNDTVRPKDFVLYHEIGHSLFKIFYPINLFSDNEVMADQFGLFIYIQKYPYLRNLQSDERYNYFSKNCQEECLSDILKIEVPNMQLPFKTFNVRS